MVESLSPLLTEYQVQDMFHISWDNALDGVSLRIATAESPCPSLTQANHDRLVEYIPDLTGLSHTGHFPYISHIP